MTERWPGELEERPDEQQPLEVEDERLEEEDSVHELPLEEEPILEEPAEAEEGGEPEEGEAVARDEAARPVEHAGGELDIPDDVNRIEGEPAGRRRGVAIVAARFNGEIVN